jgi:2'-5' RNA ligase
MALYIGLNLDEVSQRRLREYLDENPAIRVANRKPFHSSLIYPNQIPHRFSDLVINGTEEIKRDLPIDLKPSCYSLDLLGKRVVLRYSCPQIELLRKKIISQILTEANRIRAAGSVQRIKSTEIAAIKEFQPHITLGFVSGIDDLASLTQLSEILCLEQAVIDYKGFRN